jgi:hypothetical protein
MTGLKKQGVCLTFWFKFRKTESEMREREFVFPVMNQEQTRVSERQDQFYACPKNSSEMRPNVKSMLLIFVECDCVV